MRVAVMKQWMIFLWVASLLLASLAVPIKTNASGSSNLALNPSGTGYPQITALATLSGETPWEAVDGQFSYVNSPHNRWTDWATGPSTNWLTINFGSMTTFNQVKLYIYDDNGGVRAPASYKIQYGNGTTWTDVTHAVQNPIAPAAMLNTVHFDTVTAEQLRIVLTHGAAYVGVTEVEVFLDAEIAQAHAIISLLELLPDPGAVTVNDLIAIAAARQAYDKLTPSQQSLVTNLTRLSAAEAAGAALLYQDIIVHSAFSSPAGDTVTVKLGSVVDATYSMLANDFEIAVGGVGSAVTSAVYDATDPTLKTIRLSLPSAYLLNAAAATLSIQSGAIRMNNYTYNKTLSSVPIITPVSSVISLIELLPAAGEIALEHQTAIRNAREAYGKLTFVQQEQISNVSRLLAAEAALAALYEQAGLLSAFGSPDGRSIALKLSNVLNATYSIQQDHIYVVADGAPITVTNAVYDGSDPALRTITLSLGSSLLATAASVTVSMGAATFQTAHGTFNRETVAFPVLTFSMLDRNHDQLFGIDDLPPLLSDPNQPLDLNRDGQFTVDDVVSVLSQITPRVSSP